AVPNANLAVREHAGMYVGVEKIPETGSVAAEKLDIATIAPSGWPAATAIFWARDRASASRSAAGQETVCCNWGDTWVPRAPNDIVSPGLFFAIAASAEDSRATVFFRFERAVGTENCHPSTTWTVRLV